MKSKNSEMTQKYMLLLKLDAYNLFHRIKSRQHQYIEAFSLKRERSIFKDIFFSRYSKATFFDLSHLSMEVIEVVNEFYQYADELLWYLLNTQDMPNTIEDEISRFIHGLAKRYDSLELYINAELSGMPLVSDEEIEQFSDDHFQAE